MSEPRAGALRIPRTDFFPATRFPGTNFLQSATPKVATFPEVATAMDMVFAAHYRCW